MTVLCLSTLLIRVLRNTRSYLDISVWTVALLLSAAPVVLCRHQQEEEKKNKKKKGRLLYAHICQIRLLFSVRAGKREIIKIRISSFNQHTITTCNP